MLFPLAKKGNLPKIRLGAVMGRKQNWNAVCPSEALVLFLFPSRAGSSLHKGSSWAASANFSLKLKHLIFSQNKSTAYSPEPVGKPLLTADHSCSMLQLWCLLIPLGREKGETGKITLENLFQHIRESSILPHLHNSSRFTLREAAGGHVPGEIRAAA